MRALLALAMAAACVTAAIDASPAASARAGAQRPAATKSAKAPARRHAATPTATRRVATPTATIHAASSTPTAPSPTPTAPTATRTAPTPSAAPTPAVATADLEYLRGRGLLFPVPDVPPRTVRGTFHDRRGDAEHEALDVPAARGAAVVAVDDGVVAKLFASVPGGLTVYVFDDTRRFAYYYAHLDGYAEGLAEGRRVRRGDVLGRVGSTGNAAADAPHLHFAIFKLEPEPRWWVGTPIDPYPLLVPPH